MRSSERWFPVAFFLVPAAALLFLVGRWLLFSSRTLHGDATFLLSEGHPVPGHYDVHWSHTWGPSISGSLAIGGDPPMVFHFAGRPEVSRWIDETSSRSIRLTSLDPRHPGYRARIAITETHSTTWSSLPGFGRNPNLNQWFVSGSTDYWFWIGLERIDDHNATTLLGSDSHPL